MEANGIAKLVFSSTPRPHIRLSTVATDQPPVTTPTPLDFNGVWNKIFDPATNTLRITTV